MPHVDVPGARLAYERLARSGEAIDTGRPACEVVLVHGLGGNLAFWYWGVARPLSERHPVLAYDLRGHGRSELVPRGYGVEDMTADLLAMLDRLGIERAHLVGHSFGGAVALNAAVRTPERFVSLTLVDVILRLFQPQTRLADCPNWEGLRRTYAELGVDLRGDEEIDFRLLDALAGRSGRRGMRESREQTVYLPFESWNGSRRAAERWRRLLGETTLVEDVKRQLPFTRDEVAGLRLPMLAVYGGLTYALPSLEGLARAQPGLRREVVPGVGHFFPALAPQALVDALAPFLERPASRDELGAVSEGC